MKRPRIIAAALAAVTALTLAPATATAAPAPVIQTSSMSTTQVFWEDFKTPLAPGAFKGSYYESKFATYNGLLEQGRGPGVFTSEALNAHDGVMELWGHRRQRADGTWYPATSALIPKFPGKPDYVSRMKYARYEFEINYMPSSSPMPQSGNMAGWQFAFLLWPDTGQWKDGEIDFPEGRPGGDEYFFFHKLGTAAAQTCRGGHLPEWQMVGRHTYAVDWKPDGFTLSRDGKVIARENCVQPPGNMHPVFQLVTLGNNIEPWSFGSVQLLWFAAYEHRFTK